MVIIYLELWLAISLLKTKSYDLFGKCFILIKRTTVIPPYLKCVYVSIPFENDAIFEESFFMRSAMLNNITIEIQETYKDHHWMFCFLF